ncbi:MAG: metallophosphoesterase [Gemmataceae bacterium]
MSSFLVALLTLIVAAMIWAGHACLWTYVLNILYGRKLPKPILKAWRIVSFVVIVFGWPAVLVGLVLVYKIDLFPGPDDPPRNPIPALPFFTIGTYALFCLILATRFIGITVMRLRAVPPASIVSSASSMVDYGKQSASGVDMAGKGKWWWLARLPFTCAFRVEYSSYTLKLPNLPAAWDGLTILHLSDFHFHGTPTKAFFEAVFAEIRMRWPRTDVVALTGDFLDTDQHAEWIEPLFSQLEAQEGRFAILGNHDDFHRPEFVRTELQRAGYTVLGNHWLDATIRGVRCRIVGHEGPWYLPFPEACSRTDVPKICLSHSPDNIYWAAEQGCAIVLSGHVHGGQIRIPVVGPIFVPSIYSRRFDSGIFDVDGSTLVVSRGLGGKEPIRFRCPPQVIRITLRSA